ncbi:MAG: trypsin-like peptidase domain-containing protein, partial [Clostridia bacterium]|nr:trypsin-like peptidase domain-containing protein [Clostridia bacterium]
MDDNFNTIPEAEVNTTPEQAEPVQQQDTQPAQPTAPVYAPQPATSAYNAQPTPQQSPYYAPAYQPAYSQPTQPQQPVQTVGGYTPPKKKKNLGKTIFVALVCLCIVVASIGLGATLSSDSKPEDNKTVDSRDDEATTGVGAEAKTQDSPIAYEKYSGKGTMTPAQVYEAVKEINVGVIVYAQNQKAGEGSGIIVGEDPTGKFTYIITAAHVIADSGVDVQVQFHDETETEATIVGIDLKTDIGVLKVEKTGFKAATFGNSDTLVVGQTVYAIGNPGGTEFFGSFTSGMVSAIDRPVPTSNSSYDLPCIQHNAAINPGNSGGALVNEYGQVIGLNSSKISSTEYEGMGFAVPSSTMLKVYKELVANGYVSNRPMLGINYTPVSSNYSYSAIAWKNNLPYGSIIIAVINETSDLKNHGIEVGDIVTAVNGKKLDT